MPVWKWSQTAASNATADSTINWAEGQAPSTVNDSARAMMAAMAKWRDDLSGLNSLGGSQVTGGSSTAYTLSTNSVYDSLAHMSGAIITFYPHLTNTSNTSTTLSIDGLTAQPIRTAQGFSIQIAQLVAASPVTVLYNSIDACFYVTNTSVGAPNDVPPGTIVATAGTALPAGWLWCDGSIVSRTTYITLFTAIGVQYSAGDGSTTFGIPNLRNSIISGNASFPLTVGGTGPAAQLTNTNGVGFTFIASQINWMIKY